MSRLPSFLCIGTQKSGTSWLFENLRPHPGIWMPPLKELHYFDHLYCKDTRTWSRWHVKQNVSRLLKQYMGSCDHNTTDFGYVRYLVNIVSEPMFSESWYEHAFQRPGAKGKVLGDITPEYCGIGLEGIRYVRHLLGQQVRLVWLVRDPVRRALSQLRMNAERRGLAADAPAQTWLAMAQADDIPSRGDYKTYMPQWERVFGRQAILYLPFQRIASQPGQVLQAVEAFLGVDAWAGYPAADKKVHPSRPFAVPDQVQAYFEDKLVGQYRFLNGHFDADFISGI